MLAGLKILLIGILVVMAVLIVLWTMCAVTGWAFKAVDAAKARARNSQASTAQTPTPAPAQPQDTGAVPAHHLVAITAAAAAILDRPVRILRVQAPPLAPSHWTSHGRLQTFQSHRRQGDWGSVVTGLTQAQSQSR